MLEVDQGYLTILLYLLHGLDLECPGLGGEYPALALRMVDVDVVGRRRKKRNPHT